MEDYIAQYGITPYINAHDTITLYGASRMSESTRAAMAQISQIFVDIPELQEKLGDHIAEATHNEGAYIANCAAGALQLCAAAAMVGLDDYRYKCLPDTTDCPYEFIVLHSQSHCYLKAIESTGAKLKLVGDADEVLEYDLRAQITEKTAGVLYTPAITFRRGSPDLETVIRIAHDKGVPVIVDAAAQLPPVENLWAFTARGADMVVFSGGKTLCGPQTSGLILGKRKYIDVCRHIGAPFHGICRSSKASREDMIGLTVAVDQYLAADQQALSAMYEDMVAQLIAVMKGCSLYDPFRVAHGSVGQTYPRAFARIIGEDCRRVVEEMKARGIFIGSDARDNLICISPQNLTMEECATVCSALEAVGRRLTKQAGEQE